MPQPKHKADSAVEAAGQSVKQKLKLRAFALNFSEPVGTFSLHFQAYSLHLRNSILITSCPISWDFCEDCFAYMGCFNVIIKIKMEMKIYCLRGFRVCRKVDLLRMYVLLSP